MSEPRITRLTANRMARVVQDEIVRFMLDARLRPGEPMPTELELVNALGVSRNSVREAVKALQALEIVEIRHGMGTYVGKLTLKPLTEELTFRTMQSLADDARDIRELLEVREALESGLVRKVAASIPADNLATLDSLVGGMETKAGVGQTFADEDREFHQVLYRSTGNMLVPQLLTAFWDAFNRVSDEFGDADPDLVETATLHRAIVNALARRDAEAADQAMGEHFRNIDIKVENLARKYVRSRSG